MKHTRALVLLVVLLTGCASPAPLQWSAVDAANASDETITLLNVHGETVAHVSRESVRRLVDAETKLEAVSGVHAVLRLAQGDEPNAYSYPGTDGKNYIAVTMGMLDLVGVHEAEMAALLGHEMAHLALGHNAKRQEREGTRETASAIAGVVLTLARVPFGASAADVASTAIERTYSRDEEREADLRGVEYAARAGFNPHGAVWLWEKLATKSPTGGPLAFLDRHPSSAERLAAIREVVAKQPDRQ